MKILITGSSGFMGQALTQKLNGQGHELTLLNSKKRRSDYSRFFKKI
jgi:nucleoside-diphosphate-sugar epimerase